MTLRTPMFLALLALTACGSDAPGEPAPDDGVPSDLSEPAAHPPIVGDGPRTAGLRRFTVDELQATIAVVAGPDQNGEPIHWEVDVNGQTVDGLSDEAFGTMLGRPDYVSVTAEDGSPNTLYVKFVRDMARGVCDQIVAADLTRTSGHTLWRYAPVTSVATEAEITDNLSYLILRWLGHRTEVGDPMLESYRQVYETSLLAGGAAQSEGWRGVCIALFEDPAFHIH
ncbi:MAG: hypothetical protein RIF41_09240 [Polyangiaceae bacterium]